MATPHKKYILDNIATGLATITTANSYKTTIDTVDREIRTWEEVGTGSMPWVGFAPIRTTVARSDHQPSGWLKLNLRVAIAGHVAAASASARTDALANLEDDIIALMLSDPQRGVDGDGEPAAICTYLAETQSDDGDRFAMSSKGGTGSLWLEFDITYMRTSGRT